MAIRWHDVSIPLREGMTTWPGDAGFECTAVSRIAGGHSSNVSRIVLGTHVGTHVDAPWHFEEDGKQIHELDAEALFGEALLLDIPNTDVITPDHLGDGVLPPRILFKTRNSDLPDDAPFTMDYVSLAADTAQRLVDGGVRLVGVDYLSVAPYQQPGQETHHRLLRNDVVVVEGLRLAGLAAGVYRFTVLPLALVGTDGAPCRAFIGLEATQGA